MLSVYVHCGIQLQLSNLGEEYHRKRSSVDVLATELRANSVLVEEPTLSFSVFMSVEEDVEHKGLFLPGSLLLMTSSQPLLLSI